MFATDEQNDLVSDAPVASRHDEVEGKLRLVRSWLEEQGLAGVVLGGVDTVAWLTAGLTSPIERGSTTGPLRLVVTGDTFAAVTTNVERQRIDAESGLAALGIPVHDAPWFDDGGLERVAAELAGRAPAELASDLPGPGIACADDLVELRLALTQPERDRLALLAADTAAALEASLRDWRPGERDLDVLARVDEELGRSRTFAVCLIVGGDDRVERFRHPLASGAEMQRLVMAVAVAERGGLHAAATRLASAGRLPDGVRAALAASRIVEDEMLATSAAGATYGEVMLACERAYTAAGHPGAWQEHYQGGPIGYRQREFEIVPTQTESRWFGTPVAAGHALAWNPSVAGGGKSEDTYVLEEGGLRRVTDTGDWPLDDGRPAVLDVATGAAA